MEIDEFFKDKIILITGGTGSIGTYLCKYIFEKYSPKELRVLSNDPTELIQFTEKIDKRKQFWYICHDIRDKDTLSDYFRDVDYVIHLAAFKFAPEAETEREECYTTNIEGTYNIYNECLKSSTVSRVLFISSDKSVNPNCFYGQTKRFGEFLTLEYNEKSEKIFSCARFGNVFDSKNSVTILVKNQIKSHNPVTLTHPKMIRYYMSKRDAAEFICQTIYLTNGGEIFIREMPRISTGILIESIVEQLQLTYPITIEIVGFRAGEKMEEELYHEYEKLHMKRSPYKNILIVDYKLLNIVEDINQALLGKDECISYLKEKDVI